jgi:hypothetical protein
VVEKKRKTYVEEKIFLFWSTTSEVPEEGQG